jgi:hypothetical protein
MEVALQPGRFIAYGAGRDFVSSLEGVAGQLETLVPVEPERAVRLYETFLAGCYEKAEELDDSSGNFGMFVLSIVATARQSWAESWLRSQSAA